MTQRKFTVPELLDLADRMIGRGTNDTLRSNPQLQRDCLASGMILAHMLLKEVIKEAVMLAGSDDTPPVTPE